MANKALIIGVWQYGDNRIDALRAVESDINAFAELLREYGDFNGPNDVYVLPNPKMTEANAAIHHLFHDSSENDLRLLYYSGHGYRHDEIGRKPKLCLAIPETDSKHPYVNCIRGDEIKSHIESENCRSKKIAVILDCCHAEAISSDELFARDIPKPEIVKEVEAESSKLVRSAFQYNVDTDQCGGAYILCSSMAHQKSFERKVKGAEGDPEKRESLFTQTLVDGLKNGEVAPDSEFINLEQMRDYAQAVARNSGADYLPVLLNLKSRDNPPFPLLRNPVSPIDPELRSALESDDSFCRLGAVAKLDTILDKSSPERPIYQDVVSLLKKRLDRSEKDHETHDDNRKFIKRTLKRHEKDPRQSADRIAIEWRQTSLFADLASFVLLFALSIILAVFLSVLAGGEISRFFLDYILIPTFWDRSNNDWIIGIWCSMTKPFQNNNLLAIILAAGSAAIVLILLIHKLVRPSRRRSLLLIVPPIILLLATATKAIQIHMVVASMAKPQDEFSLEKKVFGCFPIKENDITTQYVWSYIFGLNELVNGLQIILVSVLVYLFWRVFILSRQQAKPS